MTNTDKTRKKLKTSVYSLNKDELRSEILKLIDTLHLTEIELIKKEKNVSDLEKIVLVKNQKIKELEEILCINEIPEEELIIAVREF